MPPITTRTLTNHRVTVLAQFALLALCLVGPSATARSQTIQSFGRNDQVTQSVQNWNRITAAASTLPDAERTLGLEVARLAKVLQTPLAAKRDDAALELSKLMLELMKSEHRPLSQHIAMAIYDLDTSDAKAGDQVLIARRRAFNVLYETTERTVPPSAHVVTIRAPGITCHGRFLDSLNENVRNTHGWIFRIEVELLRNQSPIQPSAAAKSQVMTKENIAQLIGGTTRIKFFIEDRKDAHDVARALQATRRYNLGNWKVLTPQPLLDLLVDAPIENIGAAKSPSIDE